MTNIREWLQGYPAEIAALPEGGNFIPIEVIENELDTFDSWSTQNFHYHFYRDAYAKICIAASIEVVVEYMEKERLLRRTFVGTCNFDISAIYPNKHFLSTAKSECVKNACSDMGKKLGRGLNPRIYPNEGSENDASEGISFVTGLDNVKEEDYVK